MTSNIAEFYKNKNLFITGGTGFLGVTIIEKILRSCPNVSSIIISIVDYYLCYNNCLSFQGWKSLLANASKERKRN